MSCRNLLIYLRPEAQARVVSLFHFALRQGGLLLLGNAETVGAAAGRFEVAYKAEKLYRHVGRSRPGDIGFLAGDGKPRGKAERIPAQSRDAVLAELGRRLVLEAHAPAAVLVDRRNEALFSMGPTDRYLRVASGAATHDLLAMARPGLRAKLGAAIHRAAAEGVAVTVPGGRVQRDGHTVPFDVEVQPVTSGGESLLLVCFLDRAQRGPKDAAGSRPLRRTADLEQELDATRTELQVALRDLEVLGEEQKAVNEEALSVNEEYQSTNEELLTSKEELQSLNEELTALNSQLQETLERQRTTSDDLQNVLYSTDVATLFLDRALNIRFFTPATRSLFNVIASDIGRPLADLQSLAADGALAADAEAVLRDGAPLEREIETAAGAWFTRRILPYRTHGGVEGVVITFTGITERKQAARALELAKADAEAANAAKSRFLAAASHDLRHPLQTLALLHGLLAKVATGDKAQRLLTRLDDAVAAMAGMLNTLLDINQIEAGVVRPVLADFPVGDLLARLGHEFALHATAKGLSLRVAPCTLHIHSDARLLEQMLRNLLTNALKYTINGKILLGCRRAGTMVRIEVWDSGIGMPEDALEVIFEEYHQLDNAARERSRGLGLGLSIVHRLGLLLGHRVAVRSRHGKGSVFTIDVPRTAQAAPAPPGVLAPEEAVPLPPGRTGTVLVVEDDPELRDLLVMFLQGQGHQATGAADGASALERLAEGLAPGLVLADYNLPGATGLDVAAQLRGVLGVRLPVVILTGDASADTARLVAAQGCRLLGKPVKVEDLAQVIRDALPEAGAEPAPGPAASGSPTIYVIDDDDGVREAICAVLEEDGRIAEAYPTCEAFLAAYRRGRNGCLLLDATLPGMDGHALLRQLRRSGDKLPVIMVTGSSDVPMAVAAMKAGASDFIEKPIRYDDLLAAVRRALERAQDAGKQLAWRDDAVSHMAGLTPRQHQVMALVLAGQASKNIAADLGISQRTVENHRASIMKRTGAQSLPALARLAVAAESAPA